MIGLASPTAVLLSSPVGQLLAAGNDPGGHGDDFGKSSPVGLLILILFLIAVAFLVRSMNKHLKRVPASFGPEADGRSARARSAQAEVTTDSATEATPDSTEKPAPSKSEE